MAGVAGFYNIYFDPIHSIHLEAKLSNELVHHQSNTLVLSMFEMFGNLYFNENYLRFCHSFRGKV